MDGTEGSPRARALAERLNDASAGLITVVESVDLQQWRRVPAPGVWSIGKEAEHVADAATNHQWIVRLTIGDKVSSRRPPIERSELTTGLTQREAIERIQARTEDGARLLLGLTDVQLDLPTKPPRARGERLAQTIDRVLIGHYDAHRSEIEAKLR
jgi:uncharacterized damage-inducible protein DinB